jgi:tRNA pseudouridine55 synthase
MEGNITKTAGYDQISSDTVEGILPMFLGKIQQIPPIFSAIKKGGKALYKEARAGKTAEDIEIEAREVEILNITLTECNLPEYEMEIECGGGTYIRSLVRDIAYKLDSVATMTSLQRTKQGPFGCADCLPKQDWNAESIYNAINQFNRAIESEKS